MSRSVGALVALYRGLAALLPPGARGDREEMSRAFEELLRERASRAGRVAVAARGLAGLAWVVLMEWLEFLGAIRAPGRTRMGRRGGMGWSRNLRFALRTLRKAPAFSLTSVALVAVGVGAVTTIFTLVDHVLLRPLPYPTPERLVVLDEGAFPGPFFREIRALDAVEEWAGAWTDEGNLTGSGDPQRISRARVTEEFFSLFGARARRGRLLTPGDFGGASAAVVSAGAWQRIWGGDPEILGKAIEVDGLPYTVVGVLDASFAEPEALTGSRVDVWTPVDWSAEELGGHSMRVLQVAGRLRAGATTALAQEQMDGLTTRLADEHASYRRRDGSARTTPVLSLADQTVRGVRTGLGLLMGAVGLLLLVACANVANLFLARGLGRTREMAVRRAMGAGTGSLAGQLMVESMVVGIAGGAVGVGLAIVGIRSFLALNPTALPRQASVALDPTAVGFALLVSLATSLVFGLVPVLRSVKGELADELRGAGRAATSARGVTLFRNALVASEVALSLILVAGAGLLFRSFLTVSAQPPGFDVDHVWSVPLNLGRVESAEAYLATMEEIERESRALPGVREVAFGLTAPLQFTGGGRCCWHTMARVAGREEDQALISSTHPVSADWFTTLGIRLVAGRSWERSEARSEPTPLVVDETLALELAGSPEAALGMSVGVGNMQGVVVGVAAPTLHYGLDQETGNFLYLPVERLPFPIPLASLQVRVDPTAGEAVGQRLREAIWAVEPSLPVPALGTLRASVAASTAGRRFEAMIFGTFAAVALLLAAGGLYGTLLYLAGQRRREMGIRLALGASRGRIEAQVLRAGVALGVVGVTLGLGAAWMSNRLLESRVWGVERSDPVALGGAALILLATAALASWLPARRAGRVDPVETLRVE